MTASCTLSWMPRKPLPVSEKKVGLSAKIDPQLLESIQQMADADDRTLSYMVEKAIQFFVEHKHGSRQKTDKRR